MYVYMYEVMYVYVTLTHCACIHTFAAMSDPVKTEVVVKKAKKKTHISALEYREISNKILHFLARQVCMCVCIYYSMLHIHTFRRIYIAFIITCPDDTHMPYIPYCMYRMRKKKAFCGMMSLRGISMW